MRPFSCWVCALNALQNSMMLTPCWPSAGPTGGAGLAAPAGIWSLIRVRTFFAIFGRVRLGGEWCGWWFFRISCGCLRHPYMLVSGLTPLTEPEDLSDLLHLVVPDLNGSLAPEDRDQDLELRRVLVDLGDLAREIGQRPGDHLDGLADRELGAASRPLRRLAVKKAVHLGLGERDRLVSRAHEAGHAGSVLDQVPGVVGHLHLNQDIAGHGPLLDRHPLAVLELRYLLGRDDDL